MADFLLEKDQIFVPTVLKGGDPAGDEQTLFWEMKQKVMPEYPVPDLVVIICKLPTNWRKSTCKAQRRHVFNLFPAGYLQQIHDEYQALFSTFTKTRRF